MKIIALMPALDAPRVSRMLFVGHRFEVIMNADSPHTHRWVTNIESLRAVVKPPPDAIRKKILNRLEKHSQHFVACSTLCAWKVAGESLEIAQGTRGWALPQSNGDITLSGVSWNGDPAPVGSLWVVPGIKETLRVNGTLYAGEEGARLRPRWVFLQCPKAFVRSRVWDPGAWAQGVPLPNGSATSVDEVAGRFIENASIGFAATDGEERVDVSPRGDPRQLFVRVLDSKTLLLPDRTGNRLVDTLTNLLHEPSLSLVLLQPGSGDAIRIQGSGRITDDPALLAPSAVKRRVPKLGVVVRVENVDLLPALVDALWDPAGFIDESDFPTMGEMILDQIVPGGRLNKLGARIFDLANGYHKRRKLY
ncbi:MAG: pyridoxamine 5'-phosphate oxidase family protein [Myxococcota bacterium]